MSRNNRSYNNSSSFDRRDDFPPNRYSPNENYRSNNGFIKNQGPRSFGQRSRGHYYNYQTYNGEQGNRASNHRHNNERSHRDGPFNGSRGSRHVFYDSRSRQSSVRPHSRVRLPAREEQEMTANQTSCSLPGDNILAGWDDHQEVRELNGSARGHRNPASAELSTSRIIPPAAEPSTSRIIPPKEIVEEEKQINVDDEVEWHYSTNEITSSNSVTTNIPSSPLFDFDSEDDRMVPRSRSRSRSRHREETPDDDNDEYKGKSFLPPFPMVPVSSTNDLPTRPKISRIFENDSRSSAQSFDKLVELSKVMWGSFADVPLDLASKEDVDGYEIEKRDVCKENDKRQMSPKIPKGQNLLAQPESRSGPCEGYIPESTSQHGSSSSGSQDRSGEKNNSTRKPRGDFEGVRRQLHRLKMIHQKSENVKTSQKTVETTPEKTVETTTTTETTRTETSIATASIECMETVSQKKKGKEKKDETNQVCDQVDEIFHSNHVEWLDCTLKAADDLVPKIGLLDTESTQKLLKILSSNLILNNKSKNDAKRLIHMFIKEPKFFEKVFSYMKDEINYGPDLLSVIRLTDFIVKLFPDAAQQIPRDDISTVCMRVENTFSKTESNEARQKLEGITEYRFRALRDADDQKRADYQKKIANQLGVTYQAKAPLKPSNAPKPDWIASHRLKYKKKSLIPSPEEIFNLEAMLIMPTLTPHLVDQSWLPEYEDIYRQVHFSLLRTEVVEDLQRSSVAFFAANCREYNPPNNSPFHNYVFYHDVRINDTCIDKDFTPYVKVGFKTSQRVDWIKREHLVCGSFVLLFKVKTEYGNVFVDKSSMVCAMVEYFNLDDVNNDRSHENFVGLTFFESEFDKIDLSGKYFMLESTRNYASIKPVIEWLEDTPKNIQRSFPLCQELFTCCTDNSRPVYLDNVSFDITSILVDQKRPVVTNDLTAWPNYYNHYNGHPVYNMELSCVAALRQIISRKVAVIVAPVVTSKAKVASKAVEFLNRALRQSQCFEPILIITSSSYALDSILEKLLPSFPDLIRCGSLSKCNPALKSRQIQDVVNEYLNSRRSTLFREWANARREMNNIQEELAAVWRFRKRALSRRYFVETSPKAFYDQLVPASLKRNYESKLDLAVHCLELWLSGVSESYVTSRMLHSGKVDINLQRTDTTFVSNQSSDFKPRQGILPHYNSRVSPSFLTKLSESYLFENDRTKSDGCYEDDDYSFSSAFDKETLDKIDDRAIFSPEEGLQHNSARHNTYNLEKYRTNFANTTNEFWGQNGPNIWTMSSDNRKSLYDNFLQRHIEYCDQRIRELQRSIISQAERVKSVRMARWAEVCGFSPVIGMTVNYAIANREVLGNLKPRVCIVDEASEISEAKLMYLISSDRLEHLIMFGDTQYSKPDVKSRTAQKHGLEISLFERWIKSDVRNHHILKQQSHMNPMVRDLVSVLYDEALTPENETSERDIPKIIGVPSNVFFMTHNNYDRSARSFSANPFEAEFIINFAFYLYQQGYDPAKITILTPYFSQKRLILSLLKPELKKEIPADENIYGRFDKDRNKTGKIKVELIDDYYSYENEIVLLSLVTVNENWHEEALKTLNNKKRAIIALSRAINALYIFGDEKLLRKSEIWAPIVNKLAKTPNAYGKSLILSCDTHVKPRIEITTLGDFKTKVPYGGCPEPCRGLLKCGHACQRLCHPIHHSHEVHYVCHRPCGGQDRPEECEHECPKQCYECERSGKCPPCNKIVNRKLRCGHTKRTPCYQQESNVVCEEDVSLRLRCGHQRNIRCYQKDNNEVLMTMECKEIKQFNFPNCNHRARLPCSTRSPVCKETCGKVLPCGHRCQRQCGIEHSHERSDCLSECSKVLICGHKCANGCSEPARHTSFCTKRCRIKCLHGSTCPKSCYESCTKCLEPCPWECPHYTCNKRCKEPCDRPPCEKRCNRKLKCNHQCNGYCGEECPPCLRCNPNFQCKITLQHFHELSPNERLYVLPECRCVFTADGLDLYFENQVKTGEHTAVKLWQCPSCQEPIFTAMRYNRYLKTEIRLWNVIKNKQELARNSISKEEQRQIISAMNQETLNTDLNSMVGGRWFVCPNNHPYYIGNCGGATQISRCPDCHETIGGMQHKVVSTNRFYGEFDNSASPAWPGQH